MIFTNKRLTNKTVLITGALSGIGKACAIAAAREGANIAALDLFGSETNAAMDEIKAENSSAIFIECNVSNFEEVGKAVAQIVSVFGSIDVALNNAGIGGEGAKVADMSESAWLAVIAVNLNGVFNGMKHQLQYMSKQKSGVIVNMSSILGKVAFANSAHYVAAKHGVIGLTQCAAVEYADQGIRVNAICPGFIDTPLLSKAGIDGNEQLKQYIVGLHPMKRLGQAAEIAAGFIFLASNESSFVNGTALDIDGAYLAI